MSPWQSRTDDNAGACKPLLLPLREREPRRNDRRTRTYTRPVQHVPVNAVGDRDLARGDGDTWAPQLQAIVDEASRIVGRPMIIDDRQLRLVVHTKHGEDDVDRTRLLSIMKQPLPPERVGWLEQHGLWSADQPIRIPPNDELGFHARAIAPIRCQGHHFGSLCCVDSDETLTDDDLERMSAFADEAAVVLYRQMLVSDLARSRERELLRDVLSEDEVIRREAAAQLAELTLFAADGRVVVLVIPTEHSDSTPAPESSRVAFEAALMRVRRHLAPGQCLHLVRPPHALLLVSVGDPGVRAKGVVAFARDVHGEITKARAGDDEGRSHVVAVGPVVRDAAHALTSYRRALRAANVANTVSTFGDVVCWDDLGIYQMLTETPIELLGPNALHPGLRALLEDPHSEDLLATLERYLDLAGDIQRAAQSLYLHRTTLYHRLRRVERIAGADLRKGDDRLALHLSLKIARLQGMTWSQADG
jgi:sugar diacid utilization regulator